MSTRTAAAPPVAAARPPADVTVGAYTPARSRVDTVDLLRGIVMVVMLLDHVRDYTHASGFLYDATDLARTTPALFLTRWVTHFCAPVFVFLAGTGAWFQGMRGKPKAELSRFLVTRGLWLIALEFTVVRLFAFWTVDPGFAGVFQVIWVFGVSMIVLAAFVHLPLAASVIVGATMVLLHNALDGITVPFWAGPQTPFPGWGDFSWMLLHQPGPVTVFGSSIALVLYPLIPWVGVMLLGYALGAAYAWEQERRRRLLLAVGLGAVALFLALRLTNLYGDPRPWQPQSRDVMTLLSMINTQKYPASLLYLCMTLGPALVFLAWREGRPAGRVASFFTVYGRVPLFFYLLQWLYAHAIGLVLHAAAGRDTSLYFMSLPQIFLNPPTDYGFPLWVSWACWIAGSLLLWFPCRWYAGVKGRRRSAWLSYL